ncbi:hypothetical protein D9M71_339100 [compost metagenome]
MAVPPLDHRVRRTRVGRVGLEQADRQRHVVDDVQHRGHDDEGAVEPVTHIDVLGLALDDGAEEHHTVGDPDNGQQNGDRPFQLGVFLGRGVTQRQGNERTDDHRLPTPEGEGREAVGNQSRLAGSLHDVIRSGKQCTSTEGENHQVGVQRAQASKARPCQTEVQLRPDQLRGDEDTKPHAKDPPDHRHDGELADDLIVISSRTDCCAHSKVPRFGCFIRIKNRPQVWRKQGVIATRHDLGQCFQKLILRPFHAPRRDKIARGQNVPAD